MADRAGTTGSSPVDPVSAVELHATLRSYLDDLTAPERQVLALHYGSGLTVEEIGDLLASPPPDVFRMLDRSIERLRQGMAFRRIPT